MECAQLARIQAQIQVAVLVVHQAPTLDHRQAAAQVVLRESTLDQELAVAPTAPSDKTPQMAQVGALHVQQTTTIPHLVNVAESVTCAQPINTE